MMAFGSTPTYLRSVPPSESGGAIRKVPGEKKRELRFCAGRDGAIEADRSDIVPFGGLGPELTVTGEIVQNNSGLAHHFARGQPRSASPCRLRDRQRTARRNRPAERRGRRRDWSSEALQGCRTPIFAGALLRDAGPLLSADPHADRIVERERDGDLYRLAGGFVTT